MRKSKDEAAQTREAIVAAAADHLRRAGIADSSLADMMAAAGLTHGGFYRHFRNKEQLVAEALSVAGAKTIATIRRNVERGGMSAAVDSYLSRSHRDSAVPICPFAALGSEIARSSDEVKAAAATVLEELFITFAEDDSASEARAEAIVLLCTLVGAMTLARVTANTALSEEILKHVKHHLHQ
jgi:TetR/AcrR family transcriptional regulator, transcriptional repressor for nem operon